VDEKQILRLPPPGFHPNDEDLSLGTPGEDAWGPVQDDS